MSAQGYRVCVHTDERRLLILAQCFAAGALGMARKSDSVEANQTAFLQVAAGEQVVPASMQELAQLLSRRSGTLELTERQTEVLTARARGVPWDTLARRLHISRETAEGHLKAVNAKMMKVLRESGLDPDATPADTARALGLAPGDLNDPTARQV